MRNLPRDYGRYRLTALLGVGGAAEVYRAETQPVAGITRQVAIKRIIGGAMHEGGVDTSLLDETRIWVRLQHPNVVSVIDFGEEEGDWYLALELIEGVTASEYVASMGALPAREALTIVERVARALAYVHALEENGRPMGLVHRDVKPANILLSSRGEIKLTDFGIAQAKVRSTKTQMGVLKGSASTLSPEQVREEPLDGRSDLFGLGSTLHVLLTGKPLLDLPLEQLLVALEENRVPDPPADLPEALQELLRSLTAADRNARISSAAEVAKHARLILTPDLVEDVELEIARKVPVARKRFDQERSRRSESFRRAKAEAFAAREQGASGLVKLASADPPAAAPEAPLEVPAEPEPTATVASPSVPADTVSKAADLPPAEIPQALVDTQVGVKQLPPELPVPGPTFATERPSATVRKGSTGSFQKPSDSGSVRKGDSGSVPVRKGDSGSVRRAGESTASFSVRKAAKRSKVESDPLPPSPTVERAKTPPPIPSPAPAPAEVADDDEEEDLHWMAGILASKFTWIGLAAVLGIVGLIVGIPLLRSGGDTSCSSAQGKVAETLLAGGAGAALKEIQSQSAACPTLDPDLSIRVRLATMAGNSKGAVGLLPPASSRSAEHRILAASVDFTDRNYRAAEAAAVKLAGEGAEKVGPAARCLAAAAALNQDDPNRAMGHVSGLSSPCAVLLAGAAKLQNGDAAGAKAEISRLNANGDATVEAAILSAAGTLSLVQGEMTKVSTDAAAARAAAERALLTPQPFIWYTAANPRGGGRMVLRVTGPFDDPALYTRLLQGDAARAAGSLEQAQRLYGEALRRGGRTAIADHRMAQLLLAQGKAQLARANLSRAIQFDPYYAPALVQLAMLDERDAPSAAVQRATQALALEPENADAKRIAMKGAPAPKPTRRR